MSTAGISAAARVIKQRLKNRKLPTMEVPSVESGELARTLQSVQEHFRMYEGDSGAPKERFVTIAELEEAGLLKADVKTGFAYISQVVGKDVAQKAGSTSNPTLKDPVKKDTSRTGRIPTGGGGGSATPSKQAATSTASKLGAASDVNVSKPAQSNFLYYDGGKWTNFALFNTANKWRQIQNFDGGITIEGAAFDPSDYAVAAHVHEGTAIDSTAVTDGYVLTADGAGNSAWEAIPPAGAEVNDLTAAVTWANIPIANVPTGTSSVTVALGDHAHAGVYEPADATILKDADIGVTVQAYDATYLVDADIGVNVQAYDATYVVDADIGVTVQGYDATLVAATITTIASGELLKWNGSAWINNTLAEAGIAATSHTHSLTDVTDVTALAAEVNLLDLAGLTAGWVLSADTATTASWKAPTGGVSPSGTPLDNQLAVWTNATTIEGDAGLTWDGTSLRAYGSSDSNYLSMAHDNTNATISTGGVSGGAIFLEPASGAVVGVRSGRIFRLYDSTNVAFTDFSNSLTGLTIETAAAADYVYINQPGTDTRLYFQQAGVDVAWLRQHATAIEYRSLIHGAPIQLIGENVSGTAKTIFNGDPDAAVSLYYAGVLEMATQSHTATGNTTGAQILVHDGGTHDVGLNEMPVASTNTSVTLNAQHAGQVWYNNGTAKTLTMPTSSDLDFPLYAMVTCINHSDANMTIDGTVTGMTLIWQDGVSGASTGDRTLGPRGVCNIWRHSAGAMFIWGIGLS